MKRYTKFTRLFALALAVLLVTMSFAGCVGSKTEPTDPPKDTQSAAPEVTDPPVEETEAPTEPPVTEPEVEMGTVNTDKLNVRAKANSNSPSVSKLAVGTRLEILEIQTVDDVTWGRIDGGWVNMKYVTLDKDVPDTPVPETPVAPTEPSSSESNLSNSTSSSTSTGKGSTGTVTADTLNIRKGPGTKYDSVGKVYKGDKVTILETDGNWGKIEKGWISLKYVKMDSASGSTGSSSSSSSSSTSTDKKYSTMVTDGKTTALGTVTTNQGLNVRYGPSTDYQKITTIKGGETVTYYQKSGNWIRISSGWISYKYVTEGGSSSSSSSSSGDKYSTLVTDGKTEVLGSVKTKSGMNVRYGPGTEYKVAAGLGEGETVSYYQKSGNWVRISTGWINSKYTTAVSTSGSTGSTEYKTGTGTVTASALLIRENPGTNYKEVGKLPNGATVEILEVKGNWGRIDKGWICLDYVKMN